MPTDLVVVPAAGWTPETMAEFTYDSPKGWRARGLLGYGTDGLYLQTITIEAGPASRVTAKILRDVPLSDIIASVQRTDFFLERVSRPSAEAPRQTGEPKGPGRTPLSDQLLRDVALAYLEETAPGKGRGGVKRAAERMNVDAKTMSRYVFRARQTGWLGPAIQGREGSEPGQRLVQEMPAGFVARVTRPESFSKPPGE